MGTRFSSRLPHAGRYIPAFRPAPVIALTATATPIVQDDIVKQLGLAEAIRFIHGFRRENLAIEVVEVPPSARSSLTARARPTTSTALLAVPGIGPVKAEKFGPAVCTICATES